MFTLNHMVEDSSSTLQHKVMKISNVLKKLRQSPCPS